MIRIRPALIALLAGLPLAAHAQEAQPWTATDQAGMRVIDAFPSTDPVLRARVIGAAGAGSAGAGFTGGAWGNGSQGTKTAFSAFEHYAGAAYEVQPGIEGFVTEAGHFVRFAHKPPEPDLSVTNPAVDYGDATLGPRWRHARDASLAYGAEGGVSLLGGAPHAGASGSKISGPDGGATGFFARGLVSWRGGGSLQATANLGVHYDESYHVWKTLTQTATLSRNGTSDLSEVDHTAWGIQGDGKSAIVRPIGGISLSLAPSSALRPFLEASFESESGFQARVTPGIQYTGGRGLHVLVFADVPVAHSANAPVEPTVRVGAGVQYAFGGPSRTPIPSARAPRHHDEWRVIVVDETGAPLKDAQVSLYDGTTRPISIRGVQATDSKGTALIPRDEAGAAVYAGAKKDGYVFWLPGPTGRLTAAEPGEPPTAKVTLYSKNAVQEVQFAMRDPSGAALAADKQIRLKLSQRTTTGGQANARAFPPGAAGKPYVVFVPAVLTEGPWQVEVIEADGAPLAGAVDLPPLNGGASPIVRELYLDLPHRELDAGMTVTVGDLFDADLAQVKPTSTRPLEDVVARLKATPGKKLAVVVHVKRGGDPLFLQTLGAARWEAVTTWLKSHGADAAAIEPMIPEKSVDKSATDDDIKLEIK